MNKRLFEKKIKSMDKFDFRDVYDIVREEFNARLFDGRGY